ncbi:protein kinase domain-containing protein [Spirillospora sp. CA-253888]
MWELRPGDPREIGVHRVTRRLGGGAQGQVYLCTSPEGAPVAVKLLRPFDEPSSQERQAAARRFADEYLYVRRVAPAGVVVPVLGTGRIGDRPYIVSEYVAGPSLREAVEARGPVPPTALERLAEGTLAALAALHDAGVAHGDVAPGNVLMGPDGPRVTGYGLVRATAPEDLRGWAETMVFACTGAPDPEGVEDVPDPLYDLVLASLAADPSARPTARRALDHLRGAAPVPAVPPEGDEGRDLLDWVIIMLAGLAALLVTVLVLLLADPW